MTHLPSVAIVILNYNGRAFLEKFISFAAKSTYTNAYLVVADNGSSDDSLNWMKANGFVKYDPEAVAGGRYYITLDQNWGFAEGYNLVIKEIKAEFSVLLNSDVEVTAGWLEPLVELALSTPNLGAIQPKLLAYNDKSKFEYAGASGGFIDFLGYPFCRGRIFNCLETDNGQYDSVRQIFWASGAAMFIRTQLFLEIGGLDANYFAHMEEIDLCWRLKLAGFNNFVCPSSVVYHVGGGTLPKVNSRKSYLNFRNSLISLLKNTHSNRVWLLIFIRLILDAAAVGMFLVQGQFSIVYHVFLAHIHFYKQLPTNLIKRKQVIELVKTYRKDSADYSKDLSGQYSCSIVFKHYLRCCQSFKDLNF